jgi:hypothetical protein
MPSLKMNYFSAPCIPSLLDPFSFLAVAYLPQNRLQPAPPAAYQRTVSHDEALSAFEERPPQNEIIQTKFGLDPSADQFAGQVA